MCHITTQYLTLDGKLFGFYVVDGIIGRAIWSVGGKPRVSKAPTANRFLKEGSRQYLKVKEAFTQQQLS